VRASAVQPSSRGFHRIKLFLKLWKSAFEVALCFIIAAEWKAAFASAAEPRC
jgi:hypothetical protein